MKIAAALILTATASTCSQPSEQANNSTLDQAKAAAAEVMCRDGGRASALSDIAEAAQESPQTGIGVAVYDVASDIEESGCADALNENQAKWQKQDAQRAAIMADVEAAAKN